MDNDIIAWVEKFRYNVKDLTLLLNETSKADTIKVYNRLEALLLLLKFDVADLEEAIKALRDRMI